MKQFLRPASFPAPFLLFAALLLLGGCISVKPTGSASSNKYYETFFAGDAGTQYYVKPFAFSGDAGNAWLDMTFRYRNEVRDSATVNISLIGKRLFKTLDSLNISGNGYSSTSKELKLMFNERAGSGFNSRFSTKYSLNAMSILFGKTDWIVTAYSKGEKLSFKATGKARKTLRHINNDVIILFK